MTIARLLTASDSLSPAGAIVTECWIIVHVKRETQPMLDLARDLEYEMREKDGMHVAIFIKQPWKTTLTQWIRNLMSVTKNCWNVGRFC